VASGESEAGYRELFEGNPQPMWVCHRETQAFLAVNEAALRLYGFGRAEFLDRTLRQLDPNGEGGAGTGGDRVTSARHLGKDGSALEVGLTWHSCQFGGEPAYLVLVRAEGKREAALEQRAAELSRQLEASQRELETFSYSISHDLRAPLRHIDGFSRALLDDHSEQLDQQGREYLTRIGQAAGKMSQLIEAIQQLSRVARSELELQEVNLSLAAQVISLELKHAAPLRGVEFCIAGGARAEADPRLVRQLLEVLLRNAWKFTSKSAEPRIEFGSLAGEGEKVFFVRDNGAGFDMAHAEKLFSLFHRLHRADEFEGSGVGLAIAQRIVGRHGGRIWAESAPGHGATFYFTL